MFYLKITIKKDEKICKIFNTYFTNATKDLKKRQVDKTQSFENEESCRLIKEKSILEKKPVSKNDVVSALPSNKASISIGIPVFVMKQFANCHCEKPDKPLKLDNTFKNNYRPISTLSNSAKLFGSIIYSQLNDNIENKFSKYLTCVRKNYNTQNSLLRMIESWTAKLNDGSKVGVIIMDLSKAFDSLNHNLLLVKFR